MSRPLSEPELIARLRVKFRAPEWALLSHVRNGTGFQSQTRTADAIAMSLWPSRGLHLHGFEIKSARHDWIREKDDPSKADVIAQRCDFWWIVAGSSEIVQDGELPHGWGLLVPHGDGLRTAKEPKLIDGDKEISRSFLGAILRRAVEESPAEAVIAEAVAAAVAKVESEFDVRIERAKQSASHEYAHLRQTVDTFEQASGVKISEAWNVAEIGQAVKTLVEGHIPSLQSTADNLVSSLSYALKTIKEAQKALREVGGE